MTSESFSSTAFIRPRLVGSLTGGRGGLGEPRSAGRHRARRIRRLSCLAIAAVAVTTIGSQLALPRIAAESIRGSLSGASGVRISVSAFPALKLLFGEADRVTVHVHEMGAASGGTVPELIDRAAAAADVNVTVARLYIGGIPIEGVSLDKRGRSVRLQGTLSRRAVEAVLPGRIALVARQDGKQAIGVTLLASGSGKAMSIPARLEVSGGDLRVRPQLTLAGDRTVNVFADRRVALEGIRILTAGERFTLQITARYR